MATRIKIIALCAGLIAFAPARAQEEAVNPPDVDIFDAVHAAYERDEAAGNLINDPPATPQVEDTLPPEADQSGPPLEVDPTPPTPEENQQAKDRDMDPEHPFGDPSKYDNGGPAEPLPAKGDPPDSQ